MIRKVSVIICLLVILITVGCSNKNKDNSNLDLNKDEKLLIEEPKVYDTFYGLSNIYKENKIISELTIGTEIYNDKVEKPYINGEYKEVDFANTLIEKYLQGDKSVFDALIDKSNEENLIQSLNFLKEQMALGVSDPIYFKLGQVIYDGKIDNEKNTATLRIIGYISPNNWGFVSRAEFAVEVRCEKDNLVGNIN